MVGRGTPHQLHRTRHRRPQPQPATHARYRRHRTRGGAAAVGVWARYYYVAVAPSTTHEPPTSCALDTNAFSPCIGEISFCC